MGNLTAPQTGDSFPYIFPTYFLMLPSQRIIYLLAMTALINLSIRVST